MADFDKNCDQYGTNLLPMYGNKDRLTGLNLTVIDESSYVEPYDLDEFKEHAQIDFATDDSLLAIYLKAARIDVEQYLQKSLGIRTIRLEALTIPKNYRLPFGPVNTITTSGFTLFAGMVKEGGEDVTIEYVTNASLVNDSIKQGIYKQALNYYENRDSNQPIGLDNVVDMILRPFKDVKFP